MQQINNLEEIPAELTVNVEKFSNLGYGIAKYNGFVIFVETSCPGDVAKVKITKRHKTFANAVITELLEPSKYRVTPFCPMQKICGACQMQFIDYKYQLELKKEIVSDLLKGMNIEVRDVIPSPKIKEYRRKIQYPISQTRDSKRILAGYYKQNSHEIVNIKYCPIQPASCDEIIEFIRMTAQELGVSGYNEKRHSGDLRHVIIRSSEYNNKNLVTLVINSEKISDNAQNLAKKIYAELDNVAGVSINLNSKKTNLILGKETKLIIGEGYIEEKLCEKIFKVGPDTFFQVNPSSANNLFEYIKRYISDNFENPIVLDAYAGITAFGICISDIAHKVVSVEEVKSSVDLAFQIIRDNGINNIEIHNMDAGEFFEKEINFSKKKYDITILDPPRKGCSSESLDYVLQLTANKIIYVSCNPSTLARDLKYLVDRGVTVDYVQPFDMFPHTFHIESVAILNVN